MNMYRCKIEIDINATSPKKAAIRAYELLWSGTAQKPVVTVAGIWSKKSRDTNFDLDDILTGTDPVRAALIEFVRAYHNPGGSMDFSVMDEVFTNALSTLGMTTDDIEAKDE